jgi:outer membrane biosynthesis protein TonB
MESAKDINLTRHETLNREVRDAIEKSQPLPSIPEALRLNTTKMKVTYKFK